jgi:hypothetical protein
MKKWHAWLDRGTPDNPDSDLIFTAESFDMLLRELHLKISVNQFKELLTSGAEIDIWYGEEDMGG